MITQNRTIEVGVTYAGSRKGPWKQEYDFKVPLAQVRTDAMNHFELADSTDAAGNQIVYKLMQGGETLSDLSKTVGDIAGDKVHIQLRLVREVIAG